MTRTFRFQILVALSVLTALGACGDGAPAQDAPGGANAAGQVDFSVVTVVTELEHPWGLAFLPGGDMLVTERPGRLRMIRGERLVGAPIEGVPEVWANGQGGLLDVALHPDFASNRWVYLTYSKPGPGDRATTALARGTLSRDGARLEGVRDLFVADAWTDRGVHFGSRLAFDDEGHLFMSIGDRGVMEEAQNRSNHQGTILRLTDEGGVPDGNPFAGQAGMRPEIWAYGIRSPQGLAFDPVTGQLWESEHGPRGGDELNLVEPGRNYGWPVITWGINYNGQPIGDSLTAAPGLEQPVHYWVPSIATSGLAIYDGEAFPAWRGSAFVGGLAGTHLARVSLDGTTAGGVEVLLADRGERIRDVRQGPDGFLYVLVDSGRAALLRLEPAGSS
jgi:glucose/arabinose dehydrogenase